jgi:GxxExxY protein
MAVMRKGREKKEPQMNTDEHRTDRRASIQAIPAEFNDLTEKIIGCAYRVGKTLGCGFLEKVYENALTHELRKSGLNAAQQHGIAVYYDGMMVGEFVADILVQDCILLELKAVKAFDDIHIAQCLNYLKATGLRICLLINFGAPRVEIKRLVR